MSGFHLEHSLLTISPFPLVLVIIVIIILRTWWSRIFLITRLFLIFLLFFWIRILRSRTILFICKTVARGTYH